MVIKSHRNAKWPQLNPSIAVWDAPCKAHYFITVGQVEWLPAFTDAMASSVMRNQIARHATVAANGGRGPATPAGRARSRMQKAQRAAHAARLSSR